jgi:hypothetical protein
VVQVTASGALQLGTQGDTLVPVNPSGASIDQPVRMVSVYPPGERHDAGQPPKSGSTDVVPWVTLSQCNRSDHRSQQAAMVKEDD